LKLLPAMTVVDPKDKNSQFMQILTLALLVVTYLCCIIDKKYDKV